MARQFVYRVGYLLKVEQTTYLATPLFPQGFAVKVVRDRKVQELVATYPDRKQLFEGLGRRHRQGDEPGIVQLLRKKRVRCKRASSLDRKAE